MLLAVFNPRSLQSCQKSCWRSSPLWKVGAFRLRHPLYSSPFVPATLDRRPRRQDIGCRESRSCAELMRFIRFLFPSWYILFTFFISSLHIFDVYFSSSLLASPNVPPIARGGQQVSEGYCYALSLSRYRSCPYKRERASDSPETI